MTSTELMECETDSIRQVVIPSVCDEWTELNYSDVFDTVYAVRLETTDSSLVGSVSKLEINSDTIYVLDRYKTRSLKRFSSDGQFIDMIGHCGNGPGEYVEPTDFCVTEKEILLYDQFMHKIFFYGKDGRSIGEKEVPFMGLQFYKFTDNKILFRGLDSDNYHLPKLLDFSLWLCDSLFQVKYIGYYREKDKWKTSLGINDLNCYNGKIYYHENVSDSIFSIDSLGKMKAEFFVDLKEKRVPKSLFLLENEKLSKKEYSEANYGFPLGYVVGSDILYYTFSLKEQVYHLFYNARTREMHYGNCMVDDIGGIYSFQSLLTVQDNTLIGVAEPIRFLEGYNQMSKEDWLKVVDLKHPDIGKRIVDLCEGMSMDDNPVIVFFKCK